ncbi:MAG: 16S rRNA (adenine(1518)-N(6)/adenine(1519)-N(6))-dimethyltransferase RsmA [Armatimonadetes bacterium]|nr:16S rRNA (adenine(1518)-N(6)/adenine(1519)-N(6))-dimethyltransferase RsmA [Armatimonadota bacterium]
MNLTSAPQIKKLLSDHGLRPKKRLGQNFLIDKNVLDRIVDASGAGPGVNVLEIGPGLGVVTRELAAKGARVVCVEADRDLEPALREALADTPEVEIVIEDFLKLDLPKFLGSRGEGKWVVVGNLPYYITTPIIAGLLEVKSRISSIVLMVQREVAHRIQAEAGSDDYGALSVFVQYHCDIDSVMKVSRNVFYPIPDVDSEIIRFTVRDSPRVAVRDERQFFAIVRAAFGKRRKTLLNALGTSDDLDWGKDRAAAMLAAAGIDPERRGETLTIEEFARVGEEINAE